MNTRLQKERAKTLAMKDQLLAQLRDRKHEIAMRIATCDDPVIAKCLCYAMGDVLISQAEAREQEMP